jgi:hypothetical protein
MEFDPAKGRSLEEQEGFVFTMATGIEIAEALLFEVDRDRPDVLFVDHQLRSAISAAERTGLPRAALVHTAFGFHGSWEDPEAGWDLDPLNETQTHLGMTSIPRTEHRLSIELQRRCDVALSVMVREFDRPPAVLAGLPLRALVLTGLELRVDEVPVPPNVVVRGYVPHVAVRMPEAWLTKKSTRPDSTPHRQGEADKAKGAYLSRPLSIS